jgi:hypothetical protein
LAREKTVCSEAPKCINFFQENRRRFLKLFWENAQGFLEKKKWKKTVIVNRTSQYLETVEYELDCVGFCEYYAAPLFNKAADTDRR